MGEFDAIILGAGAAGLYCAVEAGRRGRRAVVLEHNDRPGRKILISGGGRCNFTNTETRPERFLSENPDFCRSALARFTPADFVALIEKHRVPYYEKKLGQLFCRTSAKAVTDLLLAECREAGAEVRVGCKTASVEKEGGAFRVQTNQGELVAPALVVATGGLSIPKIGASDLGYRIARRFGLRVTRLRPGLVPLLWEDADRALFAPLAGVAADALVSKDGAAFRESLLFTHRGLSGPAILQISSYLEEGDAFHADLAPEGDLLADLRARRDAGERAGAKAVLAERLPERLAEALAAAVPARAVGRLSNKELAALAERVRRWRVRPKGTEGYGKAEVTVGGVDTRELSSKTMEATKAPGLYFIGEVVDVTGWLGGYNFQWAWASAAAAGRAL